MNALKRPIFGAPKPLPKNQLSTYLDVLKAFLYERPVLKLERKNAKLPLRSLEKLRLFGGKVAYQHTHTRIVQLFLTYHIKKYSLLLKNIKSKQERKAGDIN